MQESLSNKNAGHVRRTNSTSYSVRNRGSGGNFLIDIPGTFHENPSTPDRAIDKTDGIPR